MIRSPNPADLRCQLLQRRIHIQKLRSVKPRVDTRAPTRFKHVRTQLKKERLLENRFTEIERENRILLEKMNNIYNRKSSFELPRRYRAPHRVTRTVSRVTSKLEHPTTLPSSGHSLTPYLQKRLLP